MLKEDVIVASVYHLEILHLELMKWKWLLKVKQH